jgi:DNA polymerase-3 subunit gamma/tau
VSYSRFVAYQSLYRKYRPQRFSELVGQEHVRTALQNAVRDGRVGHAYLFSGPRGTGKTTTARLIAKALNCTDRGEDGDPCGVCESCVAIAEGSSLDVIEVDAASRSKVDEMRDLLERVAYLSAGGAKKVYILDEVHMLSGSAEAALLKTLEEAPGHVVFVLATTDPLKVAPTIRSRTQHFEFTLYSVEELAAHLADVCAKEGIAADAEALAVIARAGAGSMRDSLSLLDQAIAHGAIDVESIGALFGGSSFDGRLAILRAVADEDVAGALIALGEQLDSGHEPRRLAEDLLATVRDAFLLTSARGRVRVDAPDDAVDALAVLGDQVGAPMLVRMLETLGQAVVDMRGTDAADPRLVVEIALVRLARREAGTPLQALAERIDRLERGGVAAAPTAAPGTTTPAAAPASPASRASAPVPAAAAAAPSVPRPAPAQRPSARTGRSFAELRREREVSTPPPAADVMPDAAPDASDAPEPPAPDAAPAPVGEVDIDDVIVAWAEIQTGLPPATRAAVSAAQPLAVENGVITFGVPRAQYEVAVPRFRKEADNIRAALTRLLGRQMQFKPVPHDGFDADPGAAARTASGTASGTTSGTTTAAGAAPLDEEPPDDDEIDLADLIDEDSKGPAVDSVTLITQSLGATVVEEVPRD